MAKTKDIRTFKDRKYVDEVRMLYEDLGVSTNNVEKVIHKVLTQLGGTEVASLPESTFAKYMVVL